MSHKTNTTSSPLQQYLKDINSIALLTVADEQRLAHEFRDHGDTRAAHRLVEANLRFVVKIAFEYRSYGLPIADLVQEGNIGLMKAVQKFEPERGIRLISYAVWWIRAFIQGHVLRSWSLVKIGTTQAQRKLFFSLARTRREIARLSHGGPLDQEGGDVDLVASRLKVRPSDVIDMQQRLDGRDLSLDAPVGDASATHLDATPSGGQLQDEELARLEEDALVARSVAGAMSQLDARERHILSVRLMGDGNETLRDLGKHFGFSRERARQLQLRGVDKLRRELRPLADERGWPSSPAAAPRPRRRSRGDSSGTMSDPVA